MNLKAILARVQKRKGSNFILVNIYASTSADSSQVAGACVLLATNIGIISIEDCRLFRNEQGVISFSLPTHIVQTLKYGRRPIVDVDPDLLQQITLAAIRSYELESMIENTTIGASIV